MFEATSEQRMIIESATEIAEQKFVDDTFALETDIPWENIRALADDGFVGVNFDTAYGGGGLSETEAILLIEAIGRRCPDTGAFLGEQSMVAPRAIDMFGTDTLKERYLSRVTSGETGIAIAISEPEAGSDVTNMTTTVKGEEGDLRLNGEKIWVSRVPEYDAAVVWVKFPDEGMGSVVVDFDTDGVEIGQHFTNMAGHTQTQLYFSDVHIPAENVLTHGGEAFQQQLQALNWERLAVAATLNAAMLAAADRALDYAEQRVQFDEAIVDFQGMEWKFADMVTNMQASRALTYAAIPDGAESPDSLAANSAKLFAGQIAEEVVSEALQVHGANGYQQGHLLEYLYRLVRGYRIAGGTDEIHKNTIAKLLKRQGIPGAV